MFRILINATFVEWDRVEEGEYVGRIELFGHCRGCSTNTVLLDDVSSSAAYEEAVALGYCELDTPLGPPTSEEFLDAYNKEIEGLGIMQSVEPVLE